MDGSSAGHERLRVLLTAAAMAVGTVSATAAQAQAATGGHMASYHGAKEHGAKAHGKESYEWWKWEEVDRVGVGHFPPFLRPGLPVPPEFEPEEPPEEPGDGGAQTAAL